MSSCLLRSTSVATQGITAEPSWRMRVDNTFIVVGPKRSTSLDGCFRERQVRSWPGSMRRQRSSNGQAHSRGRYPRSASRGHSRSQARDPRRGISGPARRPPSTDRSSTRSSSLMSLSGRRVAAYIRTPSSSLGRSQARDPPSGISGAAPRPPSTDRFSTRSSSLMSRSGHRVGAYIRTPCQAPTGSDFRDALSEDEAVRKSSGEFGGKEDKYLTGAICPSHVCVEQRSHVASGHGEVTLMAAEKSEFVSQHRQAETLASTVGDSRKRGGKKKRMQVKKSHAGESELSQPQATRMYKCESQTPLLSDQTDNVTFFSRCKLPASWSLALLFVFSIALCSRFSMCTRNALGDFPISGSICTGQFASACEGAGFAAKAPTVTFEAYQDAIEGINGLFARSDELRTKFGSSREMLGWDDLHRRFTEMLERVKSISTRGGNVLEALEAVQIFEFHADLAFFVERLEDDAYRVPSSATIPRSRFKNDMRNSATVNTNHKSSMPRLESSPQHLVDEVARQEQPFEEARLLQQSRESNEALMSMMSLAVS